MLDVAETTNASSAPPVMASEPAVPRRRLAAPEGLTVEEARAEPGAAYRGASTPADVTLVVRHRRWRWTAELGLFVALLITVLCLFTADFLWIASRWLAWTLVPVCAGVLVRLQTLLPRVLNRTVVRVHAAGVSVRHRPLPTVLAPTELALEDLVQVFSVERRQFDPGQGPYQVKALLRGDVAMVLVDGLETAEQALFLEQRLESTLSIGDRAVARELHREEPQPGAAPRSPPSQLEPDPPQIPRRLVVVVGIATVLSAVPAVAVSVQHDTSTLGRMAVREAPATMSFEVSPERPEVFFVSEVERVMEAGNDRPDCSRHRCTDGPGFDYLVALRALDSGAARPPVRRRCNATTAFGRSVRSGRGTIEEWWSTEMPSCGVTLAPGRYEATVHLEWTSRGRPGDRVTYSRVRVHARR